MTDHFITRGARRNHADNLDDRRVIMPPLMGDRRIRIYPDTPERIMALAEQVGLKTKKVVEIENAHIIVLVK